MIKAHYFSRGRGKKKEVYYTRTFEFVINLKDEMKNESVIYIIWFGDKFYIGQAQKYLHRAQAHVSTINSFSWNPELKTSDRYLHSKANIRQHLMDHPEIETIFFDIIECCPNEQLSTCEELWFYDVCDYGMAQDCLNHHGVHSDKWGCGDMVPYSHKEGIDILL